MFTSLHYAPLPRPGACCETCGRAYGCLNSAVCCRRCAAVSCRRCFSRTCVLTVLNTSLALPLVASRHGVCDSCHPDAERERVFVDAHLPLLTHGALVQRAATGALASLLAAATGAGGASSSGREPVWLSLDVPMRQLSWRTAQLVNNAPKEAGTVGLGEVGAVLGTTATGEPLLVNPAAGSSGAGASAAPAMGVRLQSARGVALLTVLAADARQARLLLEAVSEAVAVSRLPHCAVFPSSQSPPPAPAAAASSSAGAQARAARASERDAFKASLGHVGMTHTARIMAGGGGGGGGGGTAAPAAAADGSDRGPGRPPLPPLPAPAAAASALGPPGSAGARCAHAPPPPPSGAAAAAAHSIRTGNLDADRALNSAVSGLTALGSSANRLFAGFAKPPPPATTNGGGGGAAGGGGGGRADAAGVAAAGPPGRLGGPPRTDVGRGSLHPATALAPPPPVPAALHRATSFVGAKLSAALTSLSAAPTPPGPAAATAAAGSSFSSKLVSRLDSSWFVDGGPAAN